MSNPFTTKGKPLPHVVGNSEIIREGIQALEALADLLVELGKDDPDVAVAEIAIWENTPITALISLDMETVHYGWNFDRWVKIGF